MEDFSEKFQGGPLLPAPLQILRNGGPTFQENMGIILNTKSLSETHFYELANRQGAQFARDQTRPDQFTVSSFLLLQFVAVLGSWATASASPSW